MKQQPKHFGFCGVSMVVGALLVLALIYGAIPAFMFLTQTVPDTRRAVKYLCQEQMQRNRASLEQEYARSGLVWSYTTGSACEDIK